jgi:uncharacterized delta-60 repeat protein
MARWRSGYSAGWLAKVAIVAVIGASDARAVIVAGDLDATFGTDQVGVVTVQTSSFGDELYAVAVQTDGKVVAVGTASYGTRPMVIMRLDADGTLDSTFGPSGNGLVFQGFGSFDAYALAVAIQPADGKIVVAGHSVSGGSRNMTVVRYLTDGTLDGTFGAGGVVQVNPEGGTISDIANDVVIQPDGKIVVAGSSAPPSGGLDVVVVRLLAEGTFDPAFGNAGVAVGPTGNGDVTGVALQPDGKIVVAGQNLGSKGPAVVVRYNSDGTIDSAFGPYGTGVSEDGHAFAHRVLVQPDGKIVVSGNGFGAALVRWNTDGTVDHGFGIDGKAYEDLNFDMPLPGEAVIRQPDGKLVTTSSVYAPGIDPNFGEIVGFATPVVVRFNEDGSFDHRFGLFGDGYSTPAVPLDGYVEDGNFFGLAQATDGRIVAVGRAELATHPLGHVHSLIARFLDAGGCSGIAGARFDAKKLLLPAGNDVLKFSGTLSVPTSPPIDPAANGVRIVFSDIYDDPLIDVTIPAGAGWKTKGSPPSHWTYTDKFGTLQGLTAVDFKQDKVTGDLTFKMKGKSGDFSSLGTDLVIDVFFDYAAPVPTQCAVAQWPGFPLAYQDCTALKAGDGLRCRIFGLGPGH